MAAGRRDKAGTRRRGCDRNHAWAGGFLKGRQTHFCPPARMLNDRLPQWPRECADGAKRLADPLALLSGVFRAYGATSRLRPQSEGREGPWGKAPVHSPLQALPSTPCGAPPSCSSFTSALPDSPPVSRLQPLPTSLAPHPSSRRTNGPVCPQGAAVPQSLSCSTGQLLPTQPVGAPENS